MRVGLTGGIGSGKSEVARVFAELGAFVIDTDELSRIVVAPGSPALVEISKTFPRVVVDGALDRAALAKIVFGDRYALERLNAIVHPEVRRLAHEAEQRAAPGQMLVHVVPLLFETGYDARVDRTVLVVADVAIRIARVTQRDAVDARDVRKRMDAQIDVAVARERADYVIENDGDIAHLRVRSGEVYERLSQESP